MTTITCPNCGFIHKFNKNPNKVLKKDIIVSPYWHNTIDRLTKELCQEFGIPEKFVGETLLIWSHIRKTYGIKCLFCQDIIESKIVHDIDGYLQPYAFDTKECDRGELPCTTPIVGNILAADLDMPEWGFNRDRRIAIEKACKDKGYADKKAKTIMEELKRKIQDYEREHKSL